jgi:hypothetical protein
MVGDLRFFTGPMALEGLCFYACREAGAVTVNAWQIRKKEEGSRLRKIMDSFRRPHPTSRKGPRNEAPCSQSL